MRRIGTILSAALLLLVIAFGVQAQDEQTYVVQPGDNLFRIALRFDTTIAALAEANDIANVNLIFVGQTLVIPGTTAPGGDDGDDGDDGGDDVGDVTTTYVVQPGDFLSRIAQRFSTTVAALVQLNGITNPNLIFVGQVLQLPQTGGIPDDGDGGDTGDDDGDTGDAGGFALGGQVLQGNYPYSQLMRDTGMTWVKRQIVWDRGTPASNFQGEIDAAQERGFNVLLSVVGRPDQLAQNPAQYYQEFAAFLGGLAAGGADAIEVWNEPNISREWPAGRISGSNYTQMLIPAYQVIKANNPATIVISGAPAPTGGLGCDANGCNDDAFINQMRNAGASNFMDCVGVHYNAGAVPPSATSGAPVGSASHYSWYYPSMVNLYSSTFPGLPLCFTEIGYVTAEDFDQELPVNFGWASGNTVSEQATWLAQAAQRARNSGNVRLFIVWNVDATAFTDTDPQAGYAIVRPNGTCPACNTLANALN